MAQRKKILLSACLAGINCVYDGTNKLKPRLAGLYKKGGAVLFCPETSGGLKIPHPPSEIRSGDGEDVLAGRARIVSKEGDDVTAYFLKGAANTLELAKKNGIKKAIMKSRSPSCGCGFIYDGSFGGKLKAGFGVTAALLKENGIDVVSDEEFLKGRK